jgi:enoyl-CoA hydratase/carnithine racemase
LTERQQADEHGIVSSYAQIDYAVADRIATLTLNRPEARNGYTVDMADELADAVVRADRDDDVRVLVLTGAGADFCVGADLGAGNLGAVATLDEHSDWVEPATRVTRPLFHAHKPVIAALRGAAVGVGSTMILAADYRLASTDSRFGFVFARRGIYPEGGSTWFLPRLVGLGRALDWMLSGRIIGVDEALAAGLVHSVHDPDDVVQAAYALAGELIEKSAPVSMAVIRQALYRMSALPSPEEAFRLDSKLIASVANTPDSVEGVVSFLGKRPPEWTGRVSTGLPGFLPWRESD